MEKHVRTAAEAGRDEHAWGTLCWLAGGGLGNARGMTRGRVVIRAGMSNPRHAHFRCEELLYLLAGELEHTVGEKVVTLRAGDTLTIPAGVFHNARALGGEDADMIVTYDAAERDFVLEGRQGEGAR